MQNLARGLPRGTSRPYLSESIPKCFSKSNHRCDEAMPFTSPVSLWNDTGVCTSTFLSPWMRDPGSERLVCWCSISLDARLSSLRICSCIEASPVQSKRVIYTSERQPSIADFWLCCCSLMDEFKFKHDEDSSSHEETQGGPESKGRELLTSTGVRRQEIRALLVDGTESIIAVALNASYRWRSSLARPLYRKKNRWDY